MEFHQLLHDEEPDSQTFGSFRGGCTLEAFKVPFIGFWVDPDALIDVEPVHENSLMVADLDRQGWSLRSWHVHVAGSWSPESFHRGQSFRD